MPMQANLQAADTIDHVHEGVIYSPFHRRTSAKNINQQWSVWNGYASTKYYADAHLEYFSTRNTCGVAKIPHQRPGCRGNAQPYGDPRCNFPGGRHGGL